MNESETPAYAVVSPVIGGAIVDTNLIWFHDGKPAGVVRLDFHADGSVTWHRIEHSRHA